LQQNLVLFPVALLLLAGLGAAPRAAAALPAGMAAVDATATDPGVAGGGAVGWRGEPLPSGMQRGEVPGEYFWLQDGSVMVFVPSGDFLMGSDDGQRDERPLHSVWLSGFYIDKYEVSWERWKRSGLDYSEHRGARRPWPEAPDWGIRDDEPVVMVSWNWAQRFASWAGKSLPTEAQWEKAARGVDARTWPWGNQPPDFERAVWRDHPTAKESTAAVDCCVAGASPYGAVNMAGNVYEWCEDVYDRRAYETVGSRDPLSLEGGPYRVLRGGAFLLEKDDLRSALRYRLFPSDRADYIGFRTVVAAAGPASESR